MKRNKLYTCILFTSLFLSCGHKQIDDLTSKTNNSFKNVSDSFPVNNSGNVAIITIDSCEYVVWSGSHSEVGYAHKGNCKWCKIRKCNCN